MSTKVFIVDDSKFNVKLLTDILEKNNYDVYSCTNSLLVLDMIGETKPDVVLLDIIMPGIDGFQVCKLLKATDELQDTPIIMVTSSTNSFYIKEALELGAFDYIKKPIDEIEVVARVKTALRFKFHQDKLKELAMMDGLTRLYNHTFLIELFKKEYKKQKAKSTGISFIMIDIDFFKRVNDNYGHTCGDIVLREISHILTNSVPKNSIVGRYGGEEFSVVLSGIEFEETLNICEQIRSNIENYKLNLGNEFIKLTVSIGVCYKSAEENLLSNEMIVNADKALYKAKENGKNRVENFDY